jgi:hypothetical protein
MTNLGGVGALVTPVYKFLHVGLLTGGIYFYAAIRTISYPAGNAKAVGFFLGADSKENTLNVPGDVNF